MEANFIPVPLKFRLNTPCFYCIIRFKSLFTCSFSLTPFGSEIACEGVVSDFVFQGSIILRAGDRAMKGVISSDGLVNLILLAIMEFLLIWSNLRRKAQTK